MKITLNEILKYENQSVVKRFIKENPQKADRADQIFKDLLTFFWATKRHNFDKESDKKNKKLDFVYIMDEEMREIDHMWHIFLLYTRDYMKFCDTYFGEYLHHQPDLVPIFEQNNFEFHSNLEKFLNYNYDLLGEDVITRWFAKSAHS